MAKRPIELYLLTELKNSYARYVFEKTKLEGNGMNLSKIRGLNPGKFSEFDIAISAMLEEIELVLKNRLKIENLIENLIGEDKRIYFISILNELIRWRKNLNIDKNILEQSA